MVNPDGHEAGTRNNANNFNRRFMAKYLKLDGNSKRVDSLNGEFDPDRFFIS